jgi:hypothetical protein
MSGTSPRDAWSDSATEPAPRRLPKALVWVLGSCGVVLLLAGAALLALTVAAAQGPETYVESGDRVDARWRKFLVERELLRADGERLLWFYSEGFFDPESEGTFCTDRAVVTYHTSDEGQWSSTRVAYDEIEAVHLTRSDSWIVPSILRLDRTSAPPVEIELSRERDGDVSFERAVVEHWRRARPGHDATEEHR